MNTTTQLQKVMTLWYRFSAVLDLLQPAAALAARLYVGQVFFLPGLTKLRDWDTTVALFTDEYQVPLLSPGVAAFTGTAGELVLPVLLVLGLLVVNAVAVISLSEIAPAALQQHIFWGALLAGLAIYGPGAWSLDRWLAPRMPPAARDHPDSGGLRR